MKVKKIKKWLIVNVKIVDAIKEEVLSFINDEEDDLFTLGNDFMMFQFKTDDKLVFNQKINIPVCLISLSNVIKKVDWYYPRFRLQECFYETSN